MKKLLLIGGGSGSGKSFFCEFLQRGNPGFCFLPTDDYYHDRSTLSGVELENYNFDLPENIDFNALNSDVAKLLKNEDIPYRKYDFTKHGYSICGTRNSNFEILTVEGIFALHNRNLCDMAVFKVFVDAADHVRLSRRLKRDAAIRGRSHEEITERYARHVRPMYEQFVAPSAANADLIIVNNGESGEFEESFLNAEKRILSALG